jgi:hypothetical protein
LAHDDLGFEVFAITSASSFAEIFTSASIVVQRLKPVEFCRANIVAKATTYKLPNGAGKMPAAQRTTVEDLWLAKGCGG